MDFINEQYNYYFNKVDNFAVAFSGGKDSQVILDLVSRVIPPNRYKAFFTNTGMELPCTLNTVKLTQQIYKELYPEFSLISCESNTPAIDQWIKYGPPSRINRWCCKVRKTALFARKLKDVLKTDKQPKCVVFEGVRSDESARRETYKRVGEGVKHINLINCRPIFYWNETEVFLYILCRSQVKLNEGYTFGLTRIGCNICPFASSWSEFLINKIYPEISKPYISVIEKMAWNIGLREKVKIDEYISLGNWKKNAGGKGLDIDKTRVDILKKEPNFECVVHYPKQDWKMWINTIGKYTLNIKDNNNSNGIIQFNNDIIRFDVESNEQRLKFIVYGTSGNLYLTSYMNKVLTKTAYCERCGVCEAECPTGALVIRDDRFSIDTTKCIHCRKCYDVNSYGCIVASRRKISEGGVSINSSSTRTSGVDKYSTFGLRKEWFNSLMEMGNEWFSEYPGLGPKMIPAAINWLRDARVIDLKEKKLSDLGLFLKSIYDKHQNIVWQIIWINLCMYSPVVNCYVVDLLNECRYSKLDIITMLQYRYPNLSETTLANPASALLNMFDNTPFGCREEDNDIDDKSLKMGVLAHNKSGKTVCKVGTNNISKIAIAYLMYLVAEKENSYVYTVRNFYEYKKIGPNIIFNLPLEKFHIILRNLTEGGYLNAQLLGGLDNINLISTTNSFDILKDMVSKL
jgi:phosphoadenosine phosphosulfate reductase